MDYLLKVLIYNLRTLDGQRGTAERLLRMVNIKSFKEYCKEHNIKQTSQIPQETRIELKKKNED